MSDALDYETEDSDLITTQQHTNIAKESGKKTNGILQLYSGYLLFKQIIYSIYFEN